MNYLKLITFVSIGFLLRITLRFSSYQKEISNRVEVSSPVTSWKRAVEGVSLLNLGIDPYIGDTFHESPLFLHFYRQLITNFNDFIPHIFIAIDIMTALLLCCLTFRQLTLLRTIEEQRMKHLSDKEDIKKLAIDSNLINELSLKVAVIYLLSPYSLLSCVGQSTSVFTNFLMALILLMSTEEYRILSMALFAVLSYQSFYPLVMIIPIIMITEQNTRYNITTHSKRLVGFQYLRSMLLMFTYFMISVSALLFISYNLMGNSLAFISSTYGFLWTVPDLTPNIGIFWYFFTEMFDHFRDFFLWTFQINAFIYVIPLALTLRKNAYFLSYVLLVLLSLFKPYPTVSDFALYTALLPQWKHLFSHMKQGLIIACMFISCSVLAPVLWHLWIIMGTANSNFYFGVTLAYNTAQIFLVTDLLFAFVKREYYIENGVITGPDGKLARLELAF